MPIKRFLILSIAIGLSFVSCKKQYACQCSTTFTSPGYVPYTVSSLENIDKKTTKKRADQICAHAEKQIADNDENYTNSTITTSCVIK